MGFDKVQLLRGRIFFNDEIWAMRVYQLLKGFYVVFEILCQEVLWLFFGSLKNSRNQFLIRIKPTNFHKRDENRFFGLLLGRRINTLLLLNLSIYASISEIPLYLNHTRVCKILKSCWLILSSLWVDIITPSIPNTYILVLKNK